MTILKPLCFPHKKLRQAAEEILNIDADIKQLANDLTATLYHENLLGLTATHVGVLRQMMVIDISLERNQAQIFINPKIIEQRGKAVAKEAGIAVPGVDVDVERATWIRFEALNLDGDQISIEAEDLFARVVQHEIDQLQGKLFIDRVSALKRDRAIKQFQKSKKHQCKDSGCGHNH